MAFGTKAHIVVSYSLDYNGNGITVSNDLWAKMKPAVKKDGSGKPIHPIPADSLVPIVKDMKEKGSANEDGYGLPCEHP